MFNKDTVISARYTDLQQLHIEVIYKDLGNTVNFNQTTYIEVGDPQHKLLESLGWDHERILDDTAEWKRQKAGIIAGKAKDAAQKAYEDEYQRLINQGRAREREATIRYFGSIANQEKELRKQKNLALTREREATARYFGSVAVLKKKTANHQKELDYLESIKEGQYGGDFGLTVDNFIDQMVKFIKENNDDQDMVRKVKEKTKFIGDAQLGDNSHETVLQVLNFAYDRDIIRSLQSWPRDPTQDAGGIRKLDNVKQTIDEYRKEIAMIRNTDTSELSDMDIERYLDTLSAFIKTNNWNQKAIDWAKHKLDINNNCFFTKPGEEVIGSPTLVEVLRDNLHDDEEEENFAQVLSNRPAGAFYDKDGKLVVPPNRKLKQPGKMPANVKHTFAKKPKK